MRLEIELPQQLWGVVDDVSSSAGHLVDLQKVFEFEILKYRS